MYISRTLLERTCRYVRHFLTHNLKLELRLQEVGSQKFPLFVNHHKVENVEKVVKKKPQKHVDVVCERPLSVILVGRLS